MSAPIITPPVVSTEWLNSRLTEDPTGLCVLDCSWSSSEDMEQKYKENHIPSALYFNPMYKTTSSKDNPRPVPEPDHLQQYLRSRGVNQASHVILYDNNGQCGFFIASRAWWTLKYYGLAKVSVLNGGFSKWISDGYSTTTAINTPKEGDFKVSLTPAYRCDLSEMENNLKQERFQVVDTRPTDRYTGEDDSCPFGHYPGAATVPFAQKLLDVNKGELKSEANIKIALKEAGVDLGRPMVSMCNSGMSSSTMVLVAELLGLDAKLYLNGMTEWSREKEDQLIKGNKRK